MPSVETDYLVVGAGATGLSFTDALVAASSARVILVDRRDAPGGHWNDAYPFVRLHQPSAIYGVNSMDLGGDAIETSGPNAGGYERASAPEIRAYFLRALNDVLLASGRVDYHPLTDYVGDYESRHALVSRLTGEVTEVTVRRRVVDARLFEPSIPSTHARNFAVEDATVIAPNDLVRVSGASGYTVLGSGKTAMDACEWLLAHGVDPGRIRWIRPRDAWLLNRDFVQPRDLVASMMEGVSRQAQAVAEATSLDDLFARLEESRVLLRLDRTVAPTMYRCATVNEREVATLSQVTNVVRLGRVRRVAATSIQLDDGTVATDPRQVHVDCTAEGLTSAPARPMFEPGRITLAQTRTCQPTFNASLYGFVESLGDDDASKNGLCPTNPYPRDARDWLRMWAVDGRAQSAWSKRADVSEWLEGARLNGSRGLAAHAGDPAAAPAFERFFTHVRAAAANAKVLLAS